MNHRNCFEALDRSLTYILDSRDSHIETKLFGGKTVLLGGDFRQILPVIIEGSGEDTINASLTRSSLWACCKIFRLKKNMRLLSNLIDSNLRTSMNTFAEWILNIGDGKIAARKFEEEEDEATWIKIPEDLLIKSTDDPIHDIASVIYSGIEEKYYDIMYLTERAVVTPTNETIDKVNAYVLSLIPNEEKIYYSSDSICKASVCEEDQDILYPIEFLNSLNFNGLPKHELQLKVGAPIMLLRNINQNSGLCNGTRLIITQTATRVIEAKIITGNNVGSKVYIPCITMQATEHKWPFIFKRT